ncbi:hypothetical protein PQ472_07860 [Lacticaseibacillus pabuli]|uniref:Uncharacterized protein n=1 Tax=Lacticaseibacillus pabuli TaxID=3025672 RepID=A0ABY7WNT4_9LACO|nr:hypothetical protein [Lacticaseibacillus sp. KACC 23028]WDF81840.1 hypothetical protein PQ472_07860 [Lacticaseibacillus sp. KACC 23028]
MVYIVVIREDYEDGIGGVYASEAAAQAFADSIVADGMRDAHVEGWAVCD